MKPGAIKSHLRHYFIAPKRETTIRHAFASALAPVEEYHEARVTEALRVLGQSDVEALLCVYCGERATTWDHLEALVRRSKPSGFGHTLGNLVPACRTCNSERGNKPWEAWMRTRGCSESQIQAVRSYHEKFLHGGRMISHEALTDDEERRLATLQEEIIARMGEADIILMTARLRNKDPYVAPARKRKRPVRDSSARSPRAP